MWKLTRGYSLEIFPGPQIFHSCAAAASSDSRVIPVCISDGGTEDLDSSPQRRTKTWSPARKSGDKLWLYKSLKRVEIILNHHRKHDYIYIFIQVSSHKVEWMTRGHESNQKMGRLASHWSIWVGLRCWVVQPCQKGWKIEHPLKQQPETLQHTTKNGFSKTRHTGCDTIYLTKLLNWRQQNTGLWAEELSEMSEWVLA